MRAAALALLALLAAAPASAFEAFLGTYVGAAQLVNAKTGAVQERDVTTTIEAYGQGGFSVTWTTVIRVDGRRDVPGVRLVRRRLAFEAVDGGAYYLQAPDYDPFELREPLEPMAGDALAWATVDGNVLDIWVAALTEAREGELQLHRRVVDDEGLSLHYNAFVAGRVGNIGSGRMVRVD